MNAKRVLIVRVGAMGDVLHALPAAAALRALWPGAQIDWVVDPRWAPLLAVDDGQGPVISRIHLAETRLWSRSPFSAATLRSVRNLRQALRAETYDDAIDLQGTLRSAVIGSMAGARALAGFQDPRERAARWLYGRRLTRRGAHVVNQAAALLGEALGVSLAPVAPSLPVHAGAAAWAEEFLREAQGRRTVLLAPTAGWGAKQWPTEHFGELARELEARGWSVLVNAASAADATGAAVRAASGDVVRLVACGLPELIELTRRVDVVVGGDTGPVHLAAALGRPVVALFGPTDPARNGPWGPGPKRVLRDPRSVTSHKRVAEVEPGLARLSVSMVREAVVELTRHAAGTWDGTFSPGQDTRPGAL